MIKEIVERAGARIVSEDSDHITFTWGDEQFRLSKTLLGDDLPLAASERPQPRGEAAGAHY